MVDNKVSFKFSSILSWNWVRYKFSFFSSIIAFIYNNKNSVIKFVLSLKSKVVMVNIVSMFLAGKSSLIDVILELNKIFSLLYIINSIYVINIS